MKIRIHSIDEATRHNEIINMFELENNQYKFINNPLEITNGLALMVFADDKHIDSVIKSIQIMIDRISNLGMNNKHFIQINIDETIKFNDEAQREDGDWSIKEIAFDIYETKTKQLLVNSETPIQLGVIHDVEYLIETIGYNKRQQNGYVNILPLINRLLRFRTYTADKQLELIAVPLVPALKEHFYLDLLNIKNPIDDVSITDDNGIYTTLFLKQDCVDSVITEETPEYHAVVFSEAVGINTLNDANLLTLLGQIEPKYKQISE